jgi:hypothetical protein
VALNGFLVVQPNQAKVAVFLGRYLGRVRRSGFHWVNPLTSRRNLSLRIRNLDTDVLKVNDASRGLQGVRRHPAVGMVDHALSSLNERDIVDLDEERKAAMVSNLMVVLVSDRGAQPVVNSGSLYT